MVCEQCNSWYCYEIRKCPECYDGKKIDICIGLGQESLMPAYVEVPCSLCCGQGQIILYCPYYFYYDCP